MDRVRKLFRRITRKKEGSHNANHEFLIEYQPSQHNRLPISTVSQLYSDLRAQSQENSSTSQSRTMEESCSASQSTRREERSTPTQISKREEYSTHRPTESSSRNSPYPSQVSFSSSEEELSSYFSFPHQQNQPDYSSSSSDYSAEQAQQKQKKAPSWKTAHKK